MSFLAPWFLAGALALGLPVLFHLIRQTTRQRTLFSSLMFLQASPPRLTRRNRLEHLLLLLLRCSAIGLLAVGFARPFFKHALPQPPVSELPKRMVILLDNSASMRRGNLWSEARAKVEALLRTASPATRVALVTFDRQVVPVITFADWAAAAPGERVALARQRLSQTKPGWSATRLDQGVISAAQMFSEAEPDVLAGPQQVVVISDFQEGSYLSALQGQDWPSGIEVISERVATRSSNAGLQLLSELNGPAVPAGSSRVRISNAADSKREQFQVGWARNDGQWAGTPSKLYVPAGQSRILALSPAEKNSGGDRLLMRGDDESFDNTVFSAPPETARLTVIYLGNDSDAHGPLYFLCRAFQATPRQAIQVVAKPESSSLSSAQADAATMFVLTESISEPLAAILRSQLRQGKTVLFAPASAAAATTLGTLVGEKPVGAEEAVPPNYAMLGEIDFRHPLFAPFADPRYSDFTKIHFWKYRRLEIRTLPGAHVVASFDNGDAAIIDIAAGKGRVIVFACGWQPADSQLALSTKFVPMLSSALELSVGVAEAPTQFLVGDPVSLPANWLQPGTATTVTLPDGSSLKLGAGETTFTQATMPGIYRVKSATTEKRFAVNLDPAESRTAPLPLDEMERLGAPVAKAPPEPARIARQQVLARSTELENRQKLWRWFIAATLAVVLVETGIAGWTARQRTMQKGATV